jgi:DNA-binding Lrp family transcriptional regulator
MAQSPGWEFRERDICMLKELSRDPDLSYRELADRLEEVHDIQVSHVTVSESVSGMREAGVFREAILVNEDYFRFSLFEFQFDTDSYAENWRETMETVRDDEHTMFFALSTGEYNWRSIMVFPDLEAESRWIHEFFKDHGEIIDELRNYALHNVLKFRTDPGVLDHLSED